MTPGTQVPIDLSVVIPIYNEAPNLEALHREFTEALGQWGRPYELLFIDDGSTDGSFEVLERLQGRDPHLQVIQFRRNFGQTAAFAAGFAHARGRLIATADGDLQNDPRDLPAMIARVDAGNDIVCGWRKDRKDPFLNRRLPSLIANKLISRATGVRLHDYGCSLKVFRAEVVKPLRLYGEMHRFLPALASEMGVRIAELPVNHRARVHGQSKYGLSRTMRVVLDLVTVKFLLSYSTRPLQMFGSIGAILGGLGAIILAALGFGRLAGQVSIDQHQPLLLFGILLGFAGLQLLTIGLLAEMQVRTYHESQNKPTYVIRRTLGGRSEQ
jgi:glycosyltransferase involved in cell wall biosynthesis